MNKIVLPYLLVCIFLVIFSCSNLFSNFFLLITDSNYFIPEQSSIWSFEEIKYSDRVDNSWQYAEDYSNYYYYSSINNEVLFFSKRNILDCLAFNPINYKTWCLKEI